jgi:hypothetical protein
MQRYIFEPELMPNSFRLPTTFLSLVNQERLPTLEPWWFLCIDSEIALFWLDTLRKQYPDRNLIPFAKMSDSDDLACFDGADISGNPKVLYVHAYTSPGWEQRGEVRDFQAWLVEATELAKRYAAEQGEN